MEHLFEHPGVQITNYSYFGYLNAAFWIVQNFAYSNTQRAQLFVNIDAMC